MTTTTLAGVKRVCQQRAASLGTLHAAVVGTTAGATVGDVFRVAFWSDAGKTAVWPLSSVSSNGNDGCCALLPGNILVVATKSGNQQTLLTEFLLPADPFSASPVLANAPPAFGDTNSRQTELVVLPDGSLAAVTQQQSLPAVDCVVRSPGGNYGAPQRLTVGPTSGNSYLMTACVAPWDGSLFVADMADGAPGIDAATFALKNGKLSSATAFPQVINRNTVNGSYVMGRLACNGEDPALVAVPYSGMVALSYTNVEFPVAPDPAAGTRQAHPVCAGIKPGAPVAQLAISEAWVLSILNPCPLVVNAAGLVLEYLTGYPAPNLANSGTQNAPVANNVLAWSATTRDFVAVQANGTVALIQFDATGGAPNPPQPIPPTLGNLIGSQMVSFSWSGEDPANAGKFMLQRASNAAGPWSNISNHWPVGVPGKTITPATGTVLMVDGNTFYRIATV